MKSAKGKGKGARAGANQREDLDPVKYNPSARGTQASKEGGGNPLQLASAARGELASGRGRGRKQETASSRPEHDDEADLYARLAKSNPYDAPDAGPGRNIVQGIEAQKVPAEASGSHDAKNKPAEASNVGVDQAQATGDVPKADRVLPWVEEQSHQTAPARRQVPHHQRNRTRGGSGPDRGSDRPEEPFLEESLMPYEAGREVPEHPLYGNRAFIPHTISEDPSDPHGGFGGNRMPVAPPPGRFGLFTYESGQLVAPPIYGNSEYDQFGLGLSAQETVSRVRSRFDRREVLAQRDRSPVSRSGESHPTASQLQQISQSLPRMQQSPPRTPPPQSQRTAQLFQPKPQKPEQKEQKMQHTVFDDARAGQLPIMQSSRDGWTPHFDNFISRARGLSMVEQDDPQETRLEETPPPPSRPPTRTHRQGEGQRDRQASPSRYYYQPRFRVKIDENGTVYRVPENVSDIEDEYAEATGQDRSRRRRLAEHAEGEDGGSPVRYYYHPKIKVKTEKGVTFHVPNTGSDEEMVMEVRKPRHPGKPIGTIRQIRERVQARSNYAQREDTVPGHIAFQSPLMTRSHTTGGARGAAHVREPLRPHSPYVRRAEDSTFFSERDDIEALPAVRDGQNARSQRPFGAPNDRRGRQGHEEVSMKSGARGTRHRSVSPLKSPMPDHHSRSRSVSPLKSVFSRRRSTRMQEGYEASDEGSYRPEVPPKPKLPNPPMKQMFGEKGWLDRGAAYSQMTGQKPKAGGWKNYANKVKQKAVDKKDILMQRVGAVSTAFQSDKRRSISGLSKPKSSEQEPSKFPISLDYGDQMRLFGELDLLLTTLLNEFLTKQKERGNISLESVLKVKKLWASKNRAQILEFRFDLATQLELVRLNIENLEFSGPDALNYLRQFTLIHSGKDIARELSVRSYCSADSAIKKMLTDSWTLMEMLGSDVRKSLVLQKMQVEALQKMEDAAKARENARAGVTRRFVHPNASPEHPVEERKSMTDRHGGYF